MGEREGGIGKGEGKSEREDRRRRGRVKEWMKGRERLKGRLSESVMERRRRMREEE